MKYQPHKLSSSTARYEQDDRRYLWRLLWLLPFLWASTLGEVLHHYVELPAQYHCAVEETYDVPGIESAETVQAGAKVRAHPCHGHHTHGSDQCLACRYLSRIIAPSLAPAPAFISKPLILQSGDCKILSINRRGRPVRGPPLLTI